jgi:hypothetical protein
LYFRPFVLKKNLKICHYAEDPELVRVTFSDLSETKTVWAYRSDTIKSVERAAFSSQTTESSVLLRGVKLDGQSLVHSLVDNISLYRGVFL